MAWLARRVARRPACAVPGLADRTLAGARRAPAACPAARRARRKHFRGDREELRRMLGAVRIEQRQDRIGIPAPFGNAIAALGEGVVFGVEVVGPLLAVEPGMQPRRERRDAVRFAVEHVELVGELVHDDVVRLHVGSGQHAAQFDVLPRQQDQAVGRRLAAGFLAHVVHDAVFVHRLAADQELAGVENHAAPAPVPRNPQFEDGHARLRGDADHHLVGERQAVGRGELFLGDEQRGGFTQARERRRRPVEQEGQAGERACPQRVGDGIAGELARACASRQPLGES